MAMLAHPMWTVLYNIDNGTKWVGTGWEFFDSEEEADDCFTQKIKEGHHPCKRPYHESTDRKHLGAAHQ